MRRCTAAEAVRPHGVLWQRGRAGTQPQGLEGRQGARLTRSRRQVVDLLAHEEDEDEDEDRLSHDDDEDESRWLVIEAQRRWLHDTMGCITAGRSPHQKAVRRSASLEQRHAPDQVRPQASSWLVDPSTAASGLPQV